jgi:hypothetical protein
MCNKSNHPIQIRLISHSRGDNINDRVFRISRGQLGKGPTVSNGRHFACHMSDEAKVTEGTWRFKRQLKIKTSYEVLFNFIKPFII